MNSKQKSRLNLVKIQRVCPRGVRADPGIHPSFYYRPQSWTIRRSTEDFANINGFSMMVFIILMALLTHGHGMSFQDRCLGFPKRPCYPKFMKMVAHGAPVTDGLDEFRSLRSEDTKRYKNLE